MTQPGSSPRLLVPDVARGLALLGIAMANAPTFWFLNDAEEPADYFGGAYSALDKATVLITSVTTHVRGLPMFATLLGFGVGLIVLSLWRRSFPAQRTRAVLVRRYGFLALFGALHGIFLFSGDIMFYYGLIGICLAFMFTASNKVLMTVAWVTLVVGQLMGVSIAIGFYFSEVSTAELTESAAPDTYGALLMDNLLNFATDLPAWVFFAIEYAFVFLIGFVWARSGTLADVAAHRRELVAWACVCVVVSLGCGLPWGLSALGMINPDLEPFFMLLNNSVGLLCGPGILALLALLLDGWQRRLAAGAALPLWLAIPAALGKRSMSGYLFQSIVFAVLCYPFFLGLDLDAFGIAAVAFAIWAVFLGLVWGLGKLGKPGPFEWAHRRLSYGPTMRPTLAAAGLPDRAS